MINNWNIYIIGFLLIIVLYAQSNITGYDAASTYKLLLNQVTIYLEYYPLDNETNELFEKAMTYGKNNEYDIAIIYLEEILSAINTDHDKKELNLPSDEPDTKEKESPFRFSAASGIDFNRQEFEIGYLQSDSTILEEFSKPYIGFSTEYYKIKNNGNITLHLSNSLRYDRENLRNFSQIKWNLTKNLPLRYTSYWSSYRVEDKKSFWEHEISGKYSPETNSKILWLFYNTFHYKKYKNPSSSFFNYYQNRFELISRWKMFNDYMFQSRYQNILFENLGGENFDYNLHGIGTGYDKRAYKSFSHSLDLAFELKSYSLEFEDSLFYNKYTQYKSEIELGFQLSESGKIELNETIYIKSYKNKSSLEPDYIWNYLRPAFLQDLTQSIEIGLGYEIEIKRHKDYNGDENSIMEQNYNSHGIFSSMNYFSFSGIYLSLYLSYQWRRYPDYVTNELLSVYSDRNIFSIFILAYLPITRNVTLNILASYDNDKDIDIDQQNNQSSIFSTELEYKF